MQTNTENQNRKPAVMNKVLGQGALSWFKRWCFTSTVFILKTVVKSCHSDRFSQRFFRASFSALNMSLAFRTPLMTMPVMTSPNAKTGKSVMFLNYWLRMMLVRRIRRTTHHNPIMLGTHIPTKRPGPRSTTNHRKTLPTKLAKAATANGVSTFLKDNDCESTSTCEWLCFSMVFCLMFDLGQRNW